MREPGWGRLLALAGLLAILGLVPMAIGWAGLPDPLASHWGIDGVPNDQMPRMALPLLHLGLIALGLIVAAAFQVQRRPIAESVALVGLMGVLGVVLSISTVVLNQGADRWTEAAAPGVAYILAAIVLPISAAVVGYRIGRGWYPPRQRPEGRPGHAIHVEDGEKVMWTGTCRVRYPLVLGGVAFVVLTLVSGPARWLAFPFFFVSLLLSHARVVVNDLGMRVWLGGLPVKRIELGDMRSVGVIDLEPTEWGGWGYRMASGRSAVVLRRGEAIEVMLTSGRRFAVTVDDASTGVGLLSGLVERRARAF